MSGEPRLAPDDEGFLDLLFERALEILGAGGEPEAAALLGTEATGRAHLAERAEALVDLARRVAFARPAAQPRVAGYELVRELGRGAMGRVYLARQLALGGRPVALKVLPAAETLSPQARERFLAESRALARLAHPGVVAVHDVVEAQGISAYAMEWVDGPTLARVIAELRAAGGEPDLARVAGMLGADAGTALGTSYTLFVCRLGIQLARALAAVHRAGLLHRDVKPSNVLLRRDGSALLSDFGLARDPETSLGTQTGQFLGTPAFAAPEQLRGKRELDPRADVYGLGVTLYQALTLELPFSGASPAELLLAVTTGEAVPLRRRAPHLPRDLETILAKALEVDPARRYASADELADELERLLRLEPICARAPGRWTRFQRLLGKNKKALLGAALGGAVAVLASIVLGAYLWRTPPELAERWKQARLAILLPRTFEALLALQLGGSRELGLSTDELCAILEEALGHYDHALDRDPLGLFPTTEAIRAERRIVAAAAAILSGTGREGHALELGAELPWTRDVAARWSVGSPPEFEPATVASASPADRHATGLLAFLLGEPGLAAEAWESRPLDAPPDALADGALGEIHLEADRAELAYPRLLNACRAAPDSAYLLCELADCAVRLGDLEVAEGLLARARGLGTVPYELDQRVEADLLRARGDRLAARLLYEEQIQQRSGPRLLKHAAELFEELGDLPKAIELRQRFVDTFPRAMEERCGLVAAAERWWRSLEPGERWRTVRNSFDGEDPSFGELFDFTKELLRNGDLAKFTTPTAAESSLGERVPTLFQFAERAAFLGLDRMSVRAIPPPQKNLLTMTLLTSLPRMLVVGMALTVGQSAVAAQGCPVPSEGKISAATGGLVGPLDSFDNFGRAVTSLGDVDGDGIVDLAVGAWRDDDGGGDQGAVWILFLNVDGTVASEVKISEGAGGFSGPLDPFDFFGVSAAPLGDLDGDGIEDLAVGAPGDDDGRNDQGAVWIFFLNANGTVKSSQKISATAGNFGGPLAAGDRFGVSVAALGDLDGDAIPDLAVGADLTDDGDADQGAVWILFMNTNGTVASQTKISETTGGFGGILDPSDYFGVSVGTLGDFDGDGTSDLAVGALGDDDGCAIAGCNQGAVWILFLNSDGTVASHAKISETAGGFGGSLDPDEDFGISVASLGDLDGDGVVDLAVGAGLDDDGCATDCNQGAVWILHLNVDGSVAFEEKISETAGGFGGVLDVSDRFGTSVASLGDLNGDGTQDLAVGAILDDDGGTDKGAVWVLFLESDTTPPGLSCPPLVSVLEKKATPPGEVVFFTVTASDACDPSPSIVCVPPSGSFFQRGTTLVMCTATDAYGNQSTCAFPVTVLPTVRPR